VAFVLIVLSVILLLMQRGVAHVHLLVTTIATEKSFVFLAFLAVGVVIGLLFRNAEAE